MNENGMNDIETFERWWIGKNGNEPEYGDHLHLTEDGFERLHYQYVHSMGEAREAWKQSRIDTLKEIQNTMSKNRASTISDIIKFVIDEELEKAEEN